MVGWIFAILLVLLAALFGHIVLGLIFRIIVFCLSLLIASSLACILAKLSIRLLGFGRGGSTLISIGLLLCFLWFFQRHIRFRFRSAGRLSRGRVIAFDLFRIAMPWALLVSIVLLVFVPPHFDYVRLTVLVGVLLAVVFAVVDIIFPRFFIQVFELIPKGKKSQMPQE